MLKPSKMTTNRYCEVLSYLRTKRTKNITTRECATGHPLQEYILKEELSSPTVSIYVLII